MPKLKDLEQLLSRNPPLTGTWNVYACRACGKQYPVDVRVERLPVLPRLVPNQCPHCGSAEVYATGSRIQG